MSFLFSFSKKLLTSMFLLVTISLFNPSNTFAQDEKTTITIDDWLYLGNFKVMPPAYQSEKNLRGEAFETSQLMSFNYFDQNTLTPEIDGEVRWKNTNYSWEKIKSAKNGFAIIENKKSKEGNLLGYLVTYIHTDRWTKVEIEICSPQMFEVYHNGKLVKSKKSTNKKDDEPGSAKADLCLEKGRHLILIKTLKTSEEDGKWKIKAEISANTEIVESSISTSLLPTDFMNINHLLNGEFINSATISPDGRFALLKFSETKAPKGDRKNWSEIRDLNSGALVHSFREASMYSMKWLPVGNAISYKTSDKDHGSSLWVFDLDGMTVDKIIEDIEDFGSYSWAKDGSFIIYSISEEADGKNKNLKIYEGMPDRWPWWRHRSFLYRLDVSSGVSEQLTFGHLSTNLMDIRKDGQKILFSQNTPDFSQRPYSKQYLMEMDLESYHIDTIWEKSFAGNCQYAPDGMQLLVTGSPALFGNIGINVTGDVIPNDYDIQAYIYDIASGDVDPITFNFNPNIQSAVWSDFDKNQIYFLTENRTYKSIFSYDLNTKYFEEIASNMDIVKSMSLAKEAATGVLLGSSISTPQHAVKINLANGELSPLADPRKESYKNVEFGETAEWNFTNKNGVEIEGRIYYPPNFDKNKKYPLIVYYYAGTSPTVRSFGGRYPKNIFAAQGYVVYNLQPSGATGYGQDFSAAHVNNWGISVADEIIDGTKQFLDDHKFIDDAKIGCIGASYGGFMTMLLQTRTDIFAAAISHAGISSIASYWGEGYWGYLYSSVASANSFPWDNQKMYVEQSALFNADKINTPLLLLHGGSDTNVPIGESIQLYTALKLLGKPVEFIEIKGQDHHIVDYTKRIEWNNTIFAWFDLWLKDQPEWWSQLYPERNL